MKHAIIGVLCSLVLSASPLCAAAEALPDELTLNLGTVENIGTNVTVVLKKRSVRSDTYALVLATADGPKQIDSFPVRTYRGYVKDDPVMRVNASINPDGSFNANFSEGCDIVKQIIGQKIDVPSGESTPLMSAGNKVVPPDSIPMRSVSDPGDILPPRYPMRRVRFTLNINADAMDKIGNNIEYAVAEAEQRINAADFVYARDISVAWELNTLVLNPGASASNALPPLRDIAMGSPERGYDKIATFWCRGNVCKGGHAFGPGPEGTSGGVLLHEVGHAFGTAHHLDRGDCMMGCREYVGPINTRVMLRSCDNYPVVIYSAPLPPCARQDFANTWKDTPVTIPVLDNDYDGNGDTLSLQSVQEKSRHGGSVVVADDRKQAVYTPAPGFVGQDRFAYTVVDGTGAGSRTGDVKVDVRTNGLASYFSFDEAQQDGIAWLWDEDPKENDWRTWVYDVKDGRPADKKVVYHFPDLCGYGLRGTTHWIEYEPMPGLRGNGLYNLPGGSRFAQVDFRYIGDPGRWSLSASLWVLYPQAVPQDGVILSKGALCYSSAIDWVNNGWAIAHRRGGGFKFTGNTIRVNGNEIFSLESEEAIQTNTWYHLVMVIDRDAKKLRAWVNNKEIPSTRGNATVPDGIISAYAPMILFNGFSWKRWNAAPLLADELKIFTSALTPEQVAELYAEGKDAKVPKLRK